MQRMRCARHCITCMIRLLWNRRMHLDANTPGLIPCRQRTVLVIMLSRLCQKAHLHQEPFPPRTAKDRLSALAMPGAANEPLPACCHS